MTSDFSENSENSGSRSAAKCKHCAILNFSGIMKSSIVSFWVPIDEPLDTTYDKRKDMTGE